MSVRRISLDILHDAVGVTGVVRRGDAGRLVPRGDGEVGGDVGAVLPHGDLHSGTPEALRVDIVGIGDGDRTGEVFDAFTLVEEYPDDLAVFRKRLYLGARQFGIGDRGDRIRAKLAIFFGETRSEGRDRARDRLAVRLHLPGWPCRLALRLLLDGWHRLFRAQPEGDREPRARSRLPEPRVQRFMQFSELPYTCLLHTLEESIRIHRTPRLVEGECHGSTALSIGRLHELDEPALRTAIGWEALGIQFADPQSRHALHPEPTRDLRHRIGDEEGDGHLVRDAPPFPRLKPTDEKEMMSWREGCLFRRPARPAARAGELYLSPHPSNDDAALRRLRIERTSRLDDDGRTGKEDLVGCNADFEDLAGCHGVLPCEKIIPIGTQHLPQPSRAVMLTTSHST